MTQEELEDNLLSYMEEEFGVVLEDNSEREISELICRMYQQCGRGECELVREVVANSIKADEQMKQQNFKSLIQSGDANMDDSSDEEDEEGQDDEMKAAPEEQQPTSLEEYVNRNLFGGPSKPKKELPPPRQLGDPEPQKPQPQLDDDGFAVVPTRKGSRR
jgi:pre-rRNA-processing protein TSR2